MWKKVNDYALYWSAGDKSGTVLLDLEDNSRGRVRHLSKIELAALGDIFRNENPVWFHSTRGDISTEKHPSDEEELT
ncbi:MAG TPA: hypothetical protein ENJ01_08630 [Gammaproteobacteria bacterium]|nr:hypothetical protein [Gammaproteobacteria bacterium]